MCFPHPECTESSSFPYCKVGIMKLSEFQAKRYKIEALSGLGLYKKKKKIRSLVSFVNFFGDLRGKVFKTLGWKVERTCISLTM